MQLDADCEGAMRVLERYTTGAAILLDAAGRLPDAKAAASVHL